MSNSKLLTHLRWLTDDFGVWQHTDGDEIHWEMGYALDDAARALIVFLDFDDKERAKVCLDYIIKSQTPKGFVGFYDEHRKPLDQLSSHDAHGLAIWALATAVERSFFAEEAQRILKASPTTRLTGKGYLRTLSYLLLAYCALKDKKRAEQIAKEIIATFKPELGWFEERLTYANAVMPLALLTYRRVFNIKKASLDALLTKSIETLEDYCRLGVIPAPVGNRIWQRIGNFERDIYGQQPIDPGFMVMMLVEAYRNFKAKKYARKAEEWMQWFYGDNIYKTSLITPQYACVDGLYALPRGVCKNKGAESTIMYLLAHTALESLPTAKRKG